MMPDTDDEEDLPSEVAAADIRLTTVDGLGQAVVDEDVLVLGLMMIIIIDDDFDDGEYDVDYDYDDEADEDVLVIGLQT